MPEQIVPLDVLPEQLSAGMKAGLLSRLLDAANRPREVHAGLTIRAGFTADRSPPATPHIAG